MKPPPCRPFLAGLVCLALSSCSTVRAPGSEGSLTARDEPGKLALLRVSPLAYGAIEAVASGGDRVEALGPGGWKLSCGIEALARALLAADEAKLTAAQRAARPGIDGAFAEASAYLEGRPRTCEPGGPFGEALKKIAARDWKGAIRDLEAEGGADANPLLAEVVLGIAALEDRDTNASVEHLQAAVDLDPGFSWSHYLLGRTLLQADPVKAKEELGLAILLDPASPLPEADLAQRLSREGIYESALGHARAASAKKAGFALPLAVAAGIETRERKYGDALRDADAALSLDPDLVEGLAVRGEALYGTRSYEDAAAAFDAAVKRDPPSGSHRGWKSRTLLRLHRFGEALRAVRVFGQSQTAIPSLSVPDLSGNLVALDDLRGKNAVLNVFASWCGPCRGEMKDLVAFSKAHAADEVVMVGISIDTDKEALEKLVAEFEVPYEVLWAREGAGIEPLGVSAYPTTFFLDREGIVRQRREGGLADIEGAYREAMATPVEPEKEVTEKDIGAKEIAMAFPCGCGCAMTLSECKCGCAGKGISGDALNKKLGEITAKGGLSVDGILDEMEKLSTDQGVKP